MKTQAHTYTTMAGNPTRKPIGFVVYEGPSELDGSPIVVIVNRVFTASDNVKTGDIVQTFIIRSDVSPMDALRSGEDVSVCGDCEHRPILVKGGNGKAPCYVNVGRSVLSVFGAYQRGSYVRATPEEVSQYLSDRVLRLGTYGDPFAAPITVWLPMVQAAARRVGYSHQWQHPKFDAAAWGPLVMASADTIEQRAKAKGMGLRTFRVGFGDELLKVMGETVCPASAEAGKKTTCADCRLCGGTSIKAKDIVIRDHAVGFKGRTVFNIAVA
jgi:hypothetical protein